MFRYVIIVASFIVTCWISVNGEYIEEIEGKIRTKRHDGHEMDSWYFHKLLAEIRTERDQQKKQLDVMEKIVKNFIMKTNNKCKDMTSKSWRKFDKIKKQIYNINKWINSLKRKDKEIENQLVLVKNQKGNQVTVAFYAWLSKIDTRSSIVKYERVTTNIGNCYNVNTGKFVAPVKGVYMFAVTVVNRNNKIPIHLDILKNGYRVGLARSEGTTDFDSGSTVILLNLMASDSVYVKFYNHNHGLLTYKDYTFNTFSGFLIKEQF